MPRIITSPNCGSHIVNVVTPSQGGHGETTAPDALEAMDLVPRSSIGHNGRPIPLDENGYIAEEHLAGLYAVMENITGDPTIRVNETKEYFLTAYDAFSSYDVRAVTGMVTMDRNVITYTAPADAGAGGFTINGRLIHVEVLPLAQVTGIQPPVITTPVRGMAGLTGPVAVAATAFETDNGETHVSTSWECSEKEDFSTLVASSYNDTVNKTTWSIPTVVLGKHYFIRAKYHGSAGGASAWSEETHFTSPVPTPADTPTITSPVNGATRIGARVTLTSSAYNTVTGDPHVSSSWQVSESPLFTSITFQLMDSTVNMTSWLVSGLSPAKEYYARVMYKGDLHQYTDWSPASMFRTRLAFLPEVEIAVSGNYNGVTADMDDAGGRWIVGTGALGTSGAAYIYKRNGSSSPVLEDTVSAVAPSKTMTSSIPAGGALAVTTTGRVNETRNYTQASEITIPAGAQLLSLVGKGSSSNEVTAFAVGTGNAQIPAGVTALKLIGKGGDGSYIDGTTVATAMISSGSIMQGTSAYYWDKVAGLWPDKVVYLEDTWFIGDGGAEVYGGTIVRNCTVLGTRTDVNSVTYKSDNYEVDGFIWTPFIAKTYEQVPVTGPSSTFTIQGQTYTYPGGVGVPAAPRTDNATLNGAAQTLSYAIVSTGSGQYSYPGQAGVSQSVSGTGEYILPVGTPKVSITAKGGDGAPENTDYRLQNPASINNVLFDGGIAVNGRLIYSNPSYINATQSGYAGTVQPTIQAKVLYDTGYWTGDNGEIFTKTGEVSFEGVFRHDFGIGIGEYHADYYFDDTAPVGYEQYGAGSPASHKPRIRYTNSSYVIPASQGASATFVIQGVTKTFLGGVGGPATASTQEVILNGSDLSLSYSVPATGSGVIDYSVSSIYGNSFTGTGSHTVPGDVTSVSITGRGQDGSPGDSGSKSIRTYTDVWEKKYSYGPGPSTKYVKSKSSQYETLPPINLTDGTTANFTTITETSTEVRTRYIRNSDGYYVDFVSAKYGDSVPELFVKRAIDPWQASAIYYNSDRRWCQMTWTSGPNNGQVLSGYVRFTITSHNAPFKISDADNMDEPPITLQLSWVMRDYSEVLIAQGTATYSPTINDYSFAVTDTIGEIGIDAPVINGVSSEGYGVNFIFNPESGIGVTVMSFRISYRLNPLIDSTTQPKIGTSTTVTFNGQTYTYQGGSDGVEGNDTWPAISRTDIVSVTIGSSKPLNYTVPSGGIVTVSYTTASGAGRETTVVLDGTTYTFPGSSSGSATNTTFNIDLVKDHYFGNSVAMSQDGSLAAICAAPKAANVPGYVLVLKRTNTTWTVFDELLRSDGPVWHAQSVSMSKSGDYILVGADAQPTGSTKIGSFALYRLFNGKYSLEQTVLAPDTGVAYEAGSSVSLSGDSKIAVIGAPGAGVGSRALVYERDGTGTMVLTATLSKTRDPQSTDTFGSRVFVSGDGTTIAVSSPTSRGVNTAHTNCGVVNIYRKVNGVWTLAMEVHHHNPVANLYFGQDIHLSDDGMTLSVGTPGDAANLGKVLFYDIIDTPVYKSSVQSSGASANLNFGKAIALSAASGDLVGCSKVGTYLFD